MDGNLGVTIVFTAITIGVVVIILAILNNRLKSKMINAGFVDESSVKILSSSFNNFKFDTLKWGLILLFGGAGLILLNYIPYPDRSPLPFGIEAVCLALGFLVYYFIVRSENRNKTPLA